MNMPRIYTDPSQSKTTVAIVSDMDMLEEKLINMPDVKTDEEAEMVSEYRAQFNGKAKLLDKERLEMTTGARDTVKMLNDKYNVIIERSKRMVQLADNKLLPFMRKREEERREADRKRHEQEEAERKAAREAQDAIDEANRQCFPGIVAATRETHLARMACTDDQANEIVACRCAEMDLGLSKDCGDSGDPKIAHRGKVTAASERRAVDGRDQRLAEGKNSPVVLERFGKHFFHRATRELRTIEAGTKRRPRSGQDDRANTLALLELVQSRHDLMTQCSGESVALVGPVQSQYGEAVSFFYVRQ